jgi:hypothetical protein
MISCVPNALCICWLRVFADVGHIKSVPESTGDQVELGTEPASVTVQGDSIPSFSEALIDVADSQGDTIFKDLMAGLEGATSAIDDNTAILQRTRDWWVQSAMRIDSQDVDGFRHVSQLEWNVEAIAEQKEFITLSRCKSMNKWAIAVLDSLMTR